MSERVLLMLIYASLRESGIANPAAKAIATATCRVLSV